MDFCLLFPKPLTRSAAYPVDDASWEPEANLRVNASGAVDDYDLNHPRGA
eukprot:SAG11_NODE_19838_length_457_cov_5.349162_1_plen_49_part_01